MATLAMFTDILCSGGLLNLSSASGIGQMYYNEDMVWCHKQFFTGQRGRAKSDSPNKVGMFHLLPFELQDTLLAIIQKYSYRARKDVSAALQCQRAAKAEKKRLIEDKKLQNAEKAYINDWYLFQQFQSDRCRHTLHKQRSNTNK